MHPKCAELLRMRLGAANYYYDLGFKANQPARSMARWAFCKVSGENDTNRNIMMGSTPKRSRISILARIRAYFAKKKFDKQRSDR